MKLRHLVLLQFKPNTTPEQLKAIETAFTALPASINVIQTLEWGTNNSPEHLNDGLTHCFQLTFNNEADRDAYLPHPAHVSFTEMLGPHVEKVVVFDYNV